jgi:hypothetical protein
MLIGFDAGLLPCQLLAGSWSAFYRMLCSMLPGNTFQKGFVTVNCKARRAWEYAMLHPSWGLLCTNNCKHMNTIMRAWKES